MNKEFIFFQIGKIQYKVNKFLMKELSSHGMKGIYPSHAEILGSLLLHGPLQMNQIAEFVGKDKSTVTALVKKLILKGYVEKIRDYDDNRVSIISLTRKGKTLIPDYLKISQKLRETSNKGFNEDERELLYNLLVKLEGNL